jgi:hypothetical protein
MINGHDFMNLTIKFLISGDLSCKSQCNEILRTYTYKHKAEKNSQNSLSYSNGNKISNTETHMITNYQKC